MDKLHAVVLFVEDKKGVVGSIALAVLAYLLGRNIILPDTASLITAILAALGFASVGVASTQSYQDYKLGKTSSKV